MCSHRLCWSTLGCLTRNRGAIRDDLVAIQPGSSPVLSPLLDHTSDYIVRLLILFGNTRLAACTSAAHLPGRAAPASP